MFWQWLGPHDPPERRQARAQLEGKLRDIIIPRAQYREESLSEVLATLRAQSCRLAKDGLGVNLVDTTSWGCGSGALTMEMSNVPLGELLRYVCLGVRAHQRTEDYAIFLTGGCVDPIWGTAYHPVRPDAEISEGLLQELRAADLGDGGSAVCLLGEYNLLKTSDSPGTIPKVKAILAEAGVLEEPDSPAEIDWAALPPREQTALKLRHVILPRIDLRGMDIETAVAHLANEVRKVDPFRTGVVIAVDRAAFVRAAAETRQTETQSRQNEAAAREPPLLDASGKPLAVVAPRTPRVHPFRAELSLCFADISGGNALRYVCEAVQSHWRVEDDGRVSIGREPAGTEQETHVYLLSPHQVKHRLARHKPASDVAQSAGTVTVSEDDICAIFTGVGVEFGKGSGLTWDETTRFLRVTNTAQEFHHRIAPLAEVLEPAYVHVRLPVR